MTSLFQLHNVRVTGTGEEVVVLGHGFGTDQSVWKQVIPHLEDDYRLVLFDNMGAGTTNPDYFSFDRYSTLHGYAYDLLAILEQLQVSSCIYIGHSVMGMVGCLASVERPDLFSKLILVSTSPRWNGGQVFWTIVVTAVTFWNSSNALLRPILGVPCHYVFWVHCCVPSPCSKGS